MTGLPEFQLKEYENISQAHFKTNELIAVFFRYYTLVMAEPASTAVALAIASKGRLPEELVAASALIGTALFPFRLVGVCMVLYIVELTNDAKLSAGTVNSVRDYFVQNEPDLDFVLLLPTDRLKPNFWAPTGSAGFIVFTCTTLNTLYFCAAVSAFISSPDESWQRFVWLTILISFLLHYAFEMCQSAKEQWGG